jgi:hypothetical protein
MINGRAAQNFYLEMVYHLGLVGTGAYLPPVCAGLLGRGGNLRGILQTIFRWCS